MKSKLALVLGLGGLVTVLTASADPVIQSFRGNGQITWTNDVVNSNASYRVEWSASLTGQWYSTWTHLTDIAATQSVMGAEVPMFYRVVFTDVYVPTGLCAQALYYFPFVSGQPRNYGSATVDPVLYGAAWRSEGNGDGRFSFDGLPTGAGTPMEDHDLVWLGTSPSGFPLGDFTIAASCAASNDNAIVGSGAGEYWNREWNLRRTMFYWAYEKGTSSGGTNKKFVEVTWDGVPYGTETIVAVARQGADITVYVNGHVVPHSITNYTYTGYYVRTPLPPHELPYQSLPVYSYGLMIGNTKYDSFNDKWRPFLGDIDNVIIFDRCLSSNEVQTLTTELAIEGFDD